MSVVIERAFKYLFNCFLISSSEYFTHNCVYSTQSVKRLKYKIRATARSSLIFLITHAGLIICERCNDPCDDNESASDWQRAIVFHNNINEREIFFATVIINVNYFTFLGSSNNLLASQRFMFENVGIGMSHSLILISVLCIVY